MLESFYCLHYLFALLCLLAMTPADPMTTSVGGSVGSSSTLTPLVIVTANLPEASALSSHAPAKPAALNERAADEEDDFLEENRTPPVIGSPHLWELSTQCPCCRQEPQVQDAKACISNNPNSERLSRVSLMDRDDETDETMDDAEEPQDLDETLVPPPGVLRAGVSYTPTKVLVEGWLHKKGTGHDWLYSRSWKARWGRLCLAKVEGQGSVEMPLLLMYWYPSSKTASTAIVLDSTVVVGVDAPDAAAWNASRFEIRHAGVGTNLSAVTTTRTFCATTRAERDEWVYRMAAALLEHAKSKHAARDRSSQRRALSPPSRRPPTETFLTTVDLCRPAAPVRRERPSSPPPPSLPRSPRSPTTRKVVKQP